MENQQNQESRSVGRPTKYKDEFNPQAEKLCKLGATDKELADFFEIDEATIYRWKIEYPEFCDSIKRGKQIADMEVADSLYKRANGYSHHEDVIFNDKGVPLVVQTTKHYPPDPTSMIFWLKNRQPKQWRDKQEISHSIGEVQKFKIGDQEINFE